ncbi:MAG: hypothetical protein WCK96_13335 [Methylococcales bacterium]
MKVLIILRKYSLSYATIFKPVILAGMPESSAKDGNYMIISNIILHADSKPSLRSPCDWIPASMLE